MSKHVYISGSLSSLPPKRAAEFKKFYEDLASVVEKNGGEAYVPHLHSDPEKNADMSPQAVYEVDSKEILNSDLMICEATIPSHGAGGEIEVCRHNNIPVLIISQKGVNVSRFALGNPTVVDHILYSDFEDGLKQVNTWFAQWLALRAI